MGGQRCSSQTSHRQTRRSICGNAWQHGNEYAKRKREHRKYPTPRTTKECVIWTFGPVSFVSCLLNSCEKLRTTSNKKKYFTILNSESPICTCQSVLHNLYLCPQRGPHICYKFNCPPVRSRGRRLALSLHKSAMNFATLL